ncbi:Cadmium, cobalt and zinc/H(+)-K(+) antiporter [Halomonadaceae bacterium LMG 33818]|uniref:cation transporter n=1 Tax=Cernens ardua TaxID=3402176 RepID=UPI003EDB833C
MAGGCCHHCATDTPPKKDKRWVRVIWIALILNALMFVIEIGAGVSSRSASLKADALDFLGDSINYVISLGVAGMALQWRARAAFFKGITLFLLGLWILADTVWMIYEHTLPKAVTMGVIGVIALLINLVCAFLLWRHRHGDANRRSVWICSRNDAIGNIAVVLAALGVFGTSTGWPDVIVAIVMAVLGVSGGWQIMRQSLNELRKPIVSA